LQTQTAALTGSGNQLTLILTANTDGGSEAVAFQNIVISGVDEGGNRPPRVVSTDPNDGAEYVNVDSNIEISFNEAVTTTDPWFEIVCGGVSMPATASGGPESYTLDPVSDLPSTEACSVTVFANQVADQDDPPLNMEEDYVFGFNTNAVCGDPATLISAVQGPGFVSPIVGQLVTVEGVVVGDFQEGSELSGFFVQEEDADFDGDINTSEGVFADEGGYAGPDVNEGDLVRVTGTVVENFTHTEIDAINVLACDYGPGAYGPVEVTLPEETDGDLEKVEGMNVDVTNTMSVAQNYFLGRYGQLTLSSDLTNRLFQPTNQVLPNTPESAALADYNNRHLLFLDDGVDVSSCGDNPVPVPYIGPAPPAVLRGGDHVTNLTGVLDYGTINSGGPCSDPTSFGRDYRLQPTQEPVFSTENPRTAAPDDVGGTVKAVSFNVLNFFNGDGMGGGFPTSRGADSFNEFVRQRIKIYEAMKAIDGDIVGLMEIENDGFDPYSAIAELVKVLNEGPCWDSPDECAAIGYSDPGLGAGTYAYIDAGPGIIGDDAITVGFIYKPASVTPNGSPLVVDETAFTDPNNTGSSRNRPAIAQTFDYADGDTFTAIVNHLKSKGSPCGPGDDDPEQASCNVTRTLAAEYLIDTVVPAVQASSGDPDVMIMGDLNAYAMEDPIRALTDGGFINLVKEFNGDYAYSYTFDGMVGYLDHSLANSSLTALVTGVTEWHINTDEPAVINYDEDFNPPGYYSPDAYRASDHDPVIAGICEGTPPAVTVTVDPDSLWPPNHQYVDVTATVEVDDFDSNPTITLVSVTSNEPDNGLGDGDTPDDIVIVDDFNFQLRAERSGTGDGRIYTDNCGNSTIASAEVTVPKDKGQRAAVSFLDTAAPDLDD
jgi:predicted extracellular nuclease